jgi:hypothetical protein
MPPHFWRIKFGIQTKKPVSEFHDSLVTNTGILEERFMSHCSQSFSRRYTLSSKYALQFMQCRVAMFLGTYSETFQKKKRRNEIMIAGE